MPTPIDQFDYHLPKELIAQTSVEPRDHSRLMIIDRASGSWQHKTFFHVLDHLHQGDVLVLNNTKVFRARLQGQVNQTSIELFLLRPKKDTWDALVRPGKKVRVGDIIHVYETQAQVKEKHVDGTVSIMFPLSAQEVIELANSHGHIPVPPYVDQEPVSLDSYQTVYAKHTGSVAAPTSGFHFTQELLCTLVAKGVQLEYVTLHVGIGTFRPVKADTLEEHVMHAEEVEITQEVAKRLLQAKKEGRRVIAVGTTTVRTLEGVAAKKGSLQAFSGEVNVFITPGFEFQVIDGLITNFHLPKSTLLVLVSTFLGKEKTLAVYQEAVRKRYRFFSFGDAMFIS